MAISFPLSRLMLWVAVAGVLTEFGVCLLQPRPQAVFGFAVSFLLGGVVLGWFVRGPGRAFWWGFAGVGGSYLTLAYVFSAYEYSLGVGFPTTWPLIHLGESGNLFPSAKTSEPAAFILGIQIYLKIAHSLVALGCGAVAGAAALFLFAPGRGLLRRARRLQLRRA